MIATMPITGVTLRGLLGRRRTLLMLLLVGLPVLVAVLLRIGGNTIAPDEILDPMVIRTILPLVALVFGTAALGSELEDGTAVYLIVKPIPRWRIIRPQMLVGARTARGPDPACIGGDRDRGCRRRTRFAGDDLRVRARRGGRWGRLRVRVRC